jgi:26S proteasome regulatory subunit N3
MEDIEMKDKTANKTDQNPNSSTKLLGIYLDFNKTIQIIEKNILLKDLKQLDIHYRLVNKYRKEFKDEDFAFLYQKYIKPNYKIEFYENMEETNNFQHNELTIKKYQISQEIVGFIYLILITKMVDMRLYQELLDPIINLIKYLNQNDNLTINSLKAKTYYYLCLITEKLGFQDKYINLIHEAYRLACIKFDLIGQVTLINCIIRYYLNNKNYELARSFISKTKYTENINTNEDARYLFYIGKIEAIQMNYSDSYNHLSSSFRKAPEKTGEGFKILINKYLLLVQLLMGEVPNIKTFIKSNNLSSYSTYKAYLDLLKVVNHGNLQEFKNIINLYNNIYEKDGTFNLVQRIRHVVIKVGLRKINLSYSRISIKDIQEKLKLENEKETEYIISKAIRDGVFLATINHEQNYVQSKEIKDIYLTFEPQKSFQNRIKFLNKILTDAQKSMKFSQTQEDLKKEVKDDELESEDSMDLSFHDIM